MAMEKKAENETWIKHLSLEDDETFYTKGETVPTRAVCVQLPSGNRLDIYLEDDDDGGSLHMVPSTPKTEILVTRGADGDGFEVRVEKIR